VVNGAAVRSACNLWACFESHYWKFFLYYFLILCLYEEKIRIIVIEVWLSGQWRCGQVAVHFVGLGSSPTSYICFILFFYVYVKKKWGLLLCKYGWVVNGVAFRSQYFLWGSVGIPLLTFVLYCSFIFCLYQGKNKDYFYVRMAELSKALGSFRSTI